MKKNYMICGTVASATNNGANLYLTESALKRIMPAATAAVILGTFGAGRIKKISPTELMTE